MTKLTDTQRILLTTAGHRQDGSLLPPPESIAAAGKRIRANFAALLKHGFAEESDVESKAQCWRKEEGRRIGLRITNAGHGAIGLEPGELETAIGPAQEGSLPTKDADPLPAPLARAGTKQALVIDLLKRDTGASITELAEATGWLPHTTRAALTGLRKRGCMILSEKEAGASRYRLLQEAKA